MKSKLVVGLLVLVLLLGQGLAFAEATEDVVAVAEEIDVDPVSGIAEDVLIAEDLDTGDIVEEDTVVEDDAEEWDM